MKGKEHPVISLTNKLREIFLELGFDEIINPIIVDEKEIFLQYGKEASLILDRLFYIAGLDRAEVGLSSERKERIEEIVSGFEKWDELSKFLREYKEGEIPSDSFIEELTKRFDIEQKQAIRLVDEVFLELSNLSPIPYKKTLRSHMTSSWYLTLAHLCKTRSIPIMLFSIGPRFRREQRQDPSHLFESTSVSCVVVDDSFDLDKGKNLCSTIAKEAGFPDCCFKIKEITSNYYEEGTDTEVFIDNIEIANLGFYSKASLSNYEIKNKVFNLGFGVERMAGILKGEEDLRRLVFFQFYKPKFTDQEIAELVLPEKIPRYGSQISTFIFKKILEAKDKIGPTDVLCYEGRFLGKEVRVYVYNWDEGKPLISFAGLNKVWVYNGEIFGLPDEEKALKGTEKIYKEGINTGLVFLKLIVDGFISELEDAINKGEKSLDKKIKIAQRPSDVNLFIPQSVYEFITGENKRIVVGGPLFFGLNAEIE
ncbi:TPA: O-phosphoserine--tRNA ligase [bacterium]|nr:O-phosphoserine--tRNA ligase [bacterium]